MSDTGNEETPAIVPAVLGYVLSPPRKGEVPAPPMPRYTQADMDRAIRRIQRDAGAALAKSKEDGRRQRDTIRQLLAERDRIWTPLRRLAAARGIPEGEVLLLIEHLAEQPSA